MDNDQANASSSGSPRVAPPPPAGAPPARHVIVPPPPPEPPQMTLRSLLEPEASRAFEPGGVADLPLGNFSAMDRRLALMQRALVAHDALSAALRFSGVSHTPDKLLGAINEAERAMIITKKESKWLKHLNRSANEAKHGFWGAAPF